MFCDDGVRYSTFVKKIISAKSFVTPEPLPPTESSTKFHFLDVVNWEWKLESNQLVPIVTQMNAASDNFLMMIHREIVLLVAAVGNVDYRVMQDVNHAKLAHIGWCVQR